MDQSPKPQIFRVQNPTRKRPKTGDIFAMRLEDGYLFGRVVSTDARFDALASTVNLVYIFSDVHASASPPDRRSLVPSNLLIAPVMTNNQGWLKGYFLTVANMPVAQGEVLDQHCFKSLVDGSYWDENLNRLGGPVEPVGFHGLDSYVTIDALVRKALCGNSS
jgi:hypothetical protein